jgi:hypothetical protein
MMKMKTSSMGFLKAYDPVHSLEHLIVLELAEMSGQTGRQDRHWLTSTWATQIQIGSTVYISHVLFNITPINRRATTY